MNLLFKKFKKFFFTFFLTVQINRSTDLGLVGPDRANVKDVGSLKFRLYYMRTADKRPNMHITCKYNFYSSIVSKNLPFFL